MSSWLLFLLVLLAPAFADTIDAPVNLIDFEQNPSELNYNKIDTEHFEIIFPEQVSEEAQRVAHLLEKAYPFVSRSQETMPPKISLILQNQSTQSNGFVTLAPRRTEWYITPALDPELSNTEWLKTLSIHEFRHVVQFQKTKRGFNKALYIILGEIGQAVGLGLTLPPWYLEGDAVGMETALTRGGRGRLPLFERDLRTLLLSGKKFDYDKTHLGSYEDYIPNHYVYGYFYTTLMRNQLGENFLSRVANESAETSYNPLSFYRSYKKLTGQDFDDFYRESMKELIAVWQAKLDAIKPTPLEIQNLGRKYGWTNYLFPQPLKDGRIFALKRGLSFIDQFVILDGKKEETAFFPAILMNEYPYKVRNDRVAYIEWELDPRWGYRDFSRLVVRDVVSDKVVFQKRKTKFRLAVLNPEATFVAMTEWDEFQKQSVVILDLKNGSERRFSFPKNRVITSIDWLNPDEVVLVVKDDQDLKSVVKYSLSSNAETILLPGTISNLGFISVTDGQILVESPSSGIDNIFLVDLAGEKQLTSSAFGAYAPVLHNGELIYNDYTAKGMNIVKKKVSWKEEQKSQDSFVPLFEKFAASEKFSALESEYLKKNSYEVKKYSQFKNSLNPHSWVLLAPPLSNSLVLQAYSRDVLNKFALSAGAAYNLNERTSQGFVTAAWSHYYPVFDLRAGYGTRKQDLTIAGREVENKWEEGVAEGGVQVPWTMLTGRFVHNFTIRAFSKLIKVNNNRKTDRSEVRNGALFSPGGEFSYSVLSRMSRRDLYPAYGFRMSAHFEEGHDIQGSDQRGSIKSVDSRLFLPGLGHHHSFYQQLGYEKQNENFYEYASYLYYPRGTSSVFLQELVKYSANYSLPLWNADAHWSSYIYLKRLSLNLFYDELHGNYRSFNYHAASTGWEFLFETNILRIFLPITFGIRGSYVLDGFERDQNYEVFLQQALGVF